MKTLILTVGLPRSGKSTWSIKQGFPVVNTDAIRLALHGKPFIRETEKMVWTQAYYMIKSLFHAGHDKVILDATNISEEKRKEWESEDWETVYQIFPADEKLCIKRAYKTDRPFLVGVIKEMAKNIEYPKTNLYE